MISLVVDQNFNEHIVDGLRRRSATLDLIHVRNVRTKRETIASEVQFKSGQPLSQQAEDDTRSRLTALGIFRRVDISYLQLPGNQAERDVVIVLSGQPLSVLYGLIAGRGRIQPRNTALRPAVPDHPPAGSSF